MTERKAGFMYGARLADEAKPPSLVSGAFLDGYCDGIRTASRRSGISVMRLESRRAGLRARER